MKVLSHFLTFPTLVLAAALTQVATAQTISPQKKVVAPDRIADDRFAGAVALSGDYAIVGAYRQDYDAAGAGFQDTAGAAYIYHRSGNGWTVQEKLVAPDRATGDFFGLVVDISGDYAIVGAPSERENAVGGATLFGAGSAYVFSRTANGWSFQQKLVAPDRAADDFFGGDVAISGDYAFVGAFYEDEDSSANPVTVADAGSVYVFKRSGAAWTFHQKLTAADRHVGDLFGYSLAVDGDRAIISSFVNDYDTANSNFVVNTGAAYIFRLAGTTWVQEQKIVASDRSPADYFGRAVDISGDYAIAGALWEDEDTSGGATAINAGAAYLFKRTGNTWSQHQKIAASDRDANDFFGCAVSISGTHAVVGAYGEDFDASGGDFLQSAGAAYFFSLQNSDWVETEKLAAVDRAATDIFGADVAIDGNHAIAGAAGQDTDTLVASSLNDAGAAYFFTGAWTLGIPSPHSLNPSITAVPVPAHDIVLLRCEARPLLGTRAAVTDLTGRVVHTFTVKAEEKFDVRNWPVGIYAVLFADGSRVRVVKR